MLEGKIARLVETVTQIAVEHGHPVDALRRQAAALHDLGPAATPRLRGQRV